jgi:Phytanoyl-CoA dioxygenase (PhyH)
VTPSLAQELETHGIAVVPDLLGADRLGAMQAAFARRLACQRWNDFDGYEKTEPFRHMVQDVLTLHQGFVELALHPVVKEALREYLGAGFVLCEAKGWLSLPTRRNFHGWHGDSWYDQTCIPSIPREVKVAVYLTDVRSGAFNYIKGSHGRQAPRMVRAEEVADTPPDRIVEVAGKAGTVILFDTSGIHRQGAPILEPRQAVFLNYHHPDVRLQAEDIAYYRYHPLLLNAAFLGGLTAEDQGILGFGNKAHYQEHFEREPSHRGFRRLSSRLFDTKLMLANQARRIAARLRKLVGKR